MTGRRRRRRGGGSSLATGTPRSRTGPSRVSSLQAPAARRRHLAG
uniref:Uncharacterized protein n=1 Tax=Arundo donax TaxID=35708 RepID=A0A0A9DL94_ARUDO